MNHKCPEKDCLEMVPHYLLMCPDHWRHVPRILKIRVTEAWKNRDKNLQEYLDAREVCINWINNKVKAG